MRFYLAIIIGKILDFVSNILIGRSSHRAGIVAMKICPDIIAKIGKPEKIVGITGTNGKTTVTNLIIDALENLGFKVLHNGTGANIEDGIVTTFIKGATLTRKIKIQILCT